MGRRGKGEDACALAAALGHGNEAERREAVQKFNSFLAQKKKMEPDDVPQVTEKVLDAMTNNDDVAVLIAKKVLPKLCCDTRARTLLCKWLRTRDGELPAHVRNLCYALPGLKSSTPSSHLLTVGLPLFLFVVVVCGAVAWTRLPSSPAPPNPRPARATAGDLTPCHPPSSADVERLVLGDAALQSVPLLAPALLHVLWSERAARHTRAASLHLLGAGQRAAKGRVVELVALAQGAAAPGYTHRLAGRDYDSIEREVYEAGRRCPCAVVVCDDVAQVDPAAQSVWKRLLDNNPAALRPRGSAGAHDSVDVRRLTFVLLSHRELTLPHPRPLDPLSTGLEAAVRELLRHGQQASRALNLWADRVNHVIRHHLPILPASEDPPR
eukprot:EG_transcript_12414